MHTRIGMCLPTLLIVAVLTAATFQPLVCVQSGGRIYPMNAVDAVPEQVSCPAARFSRDLTQRFDEVEIDIVFVVGVDGTVEPGTAMVLSSPDPGFDAPIIAMVSQCRFQPGRNGGDAVRVQVRRPMRFTFRQRPREPLPDTVQMNRIFSEADSVGGLPLVTQYPEMITCPRYDPRERDARSRIDDRYERERDVERMPENIDAVLEIVVGMDGEPEPRMTKVIRTSDFRFNETLTQWVRSCRFKPGMIGDRAVRVRIEFPVKFTFVRN